MVGPSVLQHVVQSHDDAAEELEGGFADGGHVEVDAAAGLDSGRRARLQVLLWEVGAQGDKPLGGRTSEGEDRCHDENIF